MLTDQMLAEHESDRESRMTSRFWPEQLEECSCHLLRCFRGRDDYQGLSFRM